MQVLPNASEETLQQLEQNLAGVTSVTSLLHEGATPLDIAKRLLTNLGMTDVQFSLQPRCSTAASACMLELHCDCPATDNDERRRSSLGDSAPDVTAAVVASWHHWQGKVGSWFTVYAPNEAKPGQAAPI